MPSRRRSWRSATTSASLRRSPPTLAFRFSTTGVSSRSFLPLGLGGACASPKLVPGVDSPYWVRVMHRSLRDRAQRYARRGKDARADAMKELAGRLERTFPNALEPVEAGVRR